ncbi:hypothetical protein ACRE_056450 [Hapsidospora chrysogenum ATCC 11550]|uniref:Uncharacterized protein n=1 Tax=Hapsidospora chrysogenum (strain ATCC 11550 / CBS 779.69 / DSM 880 / IAM 14645 / JCM 23072 / IMI 49137) TaxID=857340 RepID=A0A086T2Q9_HAPC1|nr:hypothetical protein ACRE_056450 [Hapsidospora chrysogenum ATCC 11550]
MSRFEYYLVDRSRRPIKATRRRSASIEASTPTNHLDLHTNTFETHHPKPRNQGPPAFSIPSPRGSRAGS